MRAEEDGGYLGPHGRLLADSPWRVSSCGVGGGGGGVAMGRGEWESGGG